jgi:hypothetical protein
MFLSKIKWHIAEHKTTKEKPQKSAWRALEDVFKRKLNLKCNNLQRKLNVKSINLQQNKHRKTDRKFQHFRRCYIFLFNN